MKKLISVIPRKGDIKLYMDGHPQQTYLHGLSVNQMGTPAYLPGLEKVAVGCVDWDESRSGFASYADQELGSVEVWFSVLTDEEVAEEYVRSTTARVGKEAPAKKK